MQAEGYKPPIASSRCADGIAVVGRFTSRDTGSLVALVYPWNLFKGMGFMAQRKHMVPYSSIFHISDI